jgi:hypothetical protein
MPTMRPISAPSLTASPESASFLGRFNLERLMADEDLKAELERLRQENEALKKGATRAVSIKVSEKGGVSVYGLGRFPITLYQEQWLKLLDMSDELRAFIAAHKSELKVKP